MKQILSAKSVLLFLGFYYLLTCAAVPTARSLNLVKSSMEDLPTLLDLKTDQDSYSLSNEEQAVVGKGEEGIARRMDIENIADYQGTGANNSHDPKPPSGA